MIELSGMKILITGATGGIGAEIARMLSQEGCRLVLTGRNDQAGLSLAGELAGSFFLPADLVEDEPYDIITRSAELLGGLDGLVNCAGMVLSRTLEDTSLDDFEDVMTLNARVPYFLCQAALPFLRDSSRPVIVNIGSVVSKKGYPLQSAYAASKHALLGFTKSLAAELFEEGIRVHAVLPGGVDTPMAARVRPDIDTSDLISPEEIAETVRFLIRFRGKGVVDEIEIHRGNSLPWN
ncbi:MAG: SDR family oxidoreductase [Spirochaetales bacterium]|nr:SDR family oxidoreductase [Spirochaetales bacterium]